MKEYLNPNTVTRIEDVPIKLKIDKLATLERHRLALKILLGDRIDNLRMVEGDTLDVTWTMVLEYLGRTEMHLEALSDILDDPAVIVDASCEPLEEGNILMYEVFRKLRKIVRKVRKRQEAKSKSVDMDVDIFIGDQKLATGKIKNFT